MEKCDSDHSLANTTWNRAAKKTLTSRRLIKLTSAYLNFNARLFDEVHAPHRRARNDGAIDQSSGELARILVGQTVDVFRGSNGVGSFQRIDRLIGLRRELGENKKRTKDFR